MFSTPFYTRNKWLIYLSKQKNGSIEICFVHAILFENHRELLDFKKRKQVGGITYTTIQEMNEDVLDLLVQEALKTDDRFKSPSKKKTHKPASRK